MTNAIIGRGTRVKICLIGKDRIFPEETEFTVSTTAAVAATSLSITMSVPTTRPIKAPCFLNFTDTVGREYLVKVTADIAAGTQTLTVEALKKPIPGNSVAKFPVILAQRTAANLSDADAEADVMVFENDGWKDQITTMLGNGLELPGYYSPLDAGYNTCLYTRLNFGEIFWQLELPIPSSADSGYTKGHIIKGFGGVKMPIETPADNIINSSISITSRGPVTFIDPA